MLVLLKGHISVFTGRFVKLKTAFKIWFLSSNKVNDDIRHQEIEQIKYIKYFSGHKDRVVCLEMCPGQEGT